MTKAELELLRTWVRTEARAVTEAHEHVIHRMDGDISATIQSVKTFEALCAAVCKEDE